MGARRPAVEESHRIELFSFEYFFGMLEA